MPELPEVETVKNLLSKTVLGRKIDTVSVLRAKNIDGDVDEFASLLKGKTIKGFSRVGKFIVFHFDHDIVMISHLRMEGKYYLRSVEEKLEKHDIVVFMFDDGDYLVTYNRTP